MKPIKTTLFITGAILFSMILASLKVQAQTTRLTSSQKVECEVQYYRENKIILNNLANVLSANKTTTSMKDKIRDVEIALIKAEISQAHTTTSDSDCQAHLMDAEMELKGQNPSASQD